MARAWKVGPLALALASGAAAQMDRAAERELLADAASHASLVADERPLTIGGATMFRYNLNIRDQTPAGDEDVTVGFQTRLTTIWFEGGISDFVGYKLQGNFDRDDGEFVLEDAYATFRLDNHLTAGGGQFRLPLLWEDFVEPWNQLGVEKSPTATALGQDRTQGLWLDYKTGSVRYFGSVNDGTPTANTDFRSADSTDLGLTGRVDWLFHTTDWERFDDFTSWRGSERAGKIGLGIHREFGGATGRTANQDLWLFTIDAAYESDGWNAFASGVLRNTDPNTLGELNDWGFTLQGGYFLNDAWELFARYDITQADADRFVGAAELSTLTLGANRYLIPFSQAAKLSFDVTIFIDSFQKSLHNADTRIGILEDDGEPQATFRAQLQLLW